MNVHILIIAFCLGLTSAMDFDTKLFKPTFFQTSIQEKLAWYRNLATTRENLSSSKESSPDPNKDFYLNEDFNWDSVDD